MPELEVLHRARGVLRYWDCIFYHPMYHALTHYGPLALHSHARPARREQQLRPNPGAGAGAGYAGPAMA